MGTSSPPDPFGERLAGGRRFEMAVANHFVAHGYVVVPAYHTDREESEGPRILSPGGPLVAPDFIAMKVGVEKHVYFVEVKSKRAPVWLDRAKVWATGIDTKYYDDYLAIQKSTGVPVVLAFVLHGDGGREDQPRGIYAANLVKLSGKEFSHNDTMIMWDVRRLQKIGDIESLGDCVMC